MSGLNDAQKRAVETTEGPLLILAGAGAGKTRVITHRILHLIKKGVAPSAILAITFTNKAASEMRDRVKELMANDHGWNSEQPFIRTFHALGVHIIRENAAVLGLTRHFTIYDRSDSRRAVKDSLEQLSLDTKKFEPNAILGSISRAKGDGMNQAQYAAQARDFFHETVAQVWGKYDGILAKEKALDFEKLLLKTSQLLSSHESIRARYGSIWRYIHIDEYQDTNNAQYQIAQYLAGTHRNICVVGDADQNTYSWRGATIENILNFEKDYPEASVTA